MIDQLTEAYANYLQGSYDCPDRIVLNGYYRLGVVHQDIVERIT